MDPSVDVATSHLINEPIIAYLFLISANIPYTLLETAANTPYNLLEIAATVSWTYIISNSP